MQFVFVLALIIATLATTTQADLLSNLPVVGGVVKPVTDATKDIPVVNSVVDNLESLPIGNLTEVTDNLSLVALLQTILDLLDQTLTNLLSGDGIPDVRNVADVANVAGGV